MVDGAKTRVLAYVRVSSEKQADEGLSLETQREKLRAYAFAMDLDIVDHHADEGVSAKNLKRPGLQTALQRLERGDAEGMVVVKLDRLTRSVKDLGWLIEPERFGEEWTLLSVNDSIDTRSASGRLVLNILSSVSQWEREATAERTREVLSYLKSQGVTLGAAPFGLRHSENTDENNRRIIEQDQEELETVSEIQRLRDEGLALRAIAQELNVQGRRTKRGKRWYASSVRYVLQRLEES